MIIIRRDINARVANKSERWNILITRRRPHKQERKAKDVERLDRNKIEDVKVKREHEIELDHFNNNGVTKNK